MTEYQSVTNMSDDWENIMFQLMPPPPEMPLDDYLLRYKDSCAILYFRFFLHACEPMINRKLRKFCKTFVLESHFKDLKLVYVETIFTELVRFDHTLGIPFFAFANKQLSVVLHDYARLHGSFYAIQQTGHYRALRTVAYFYYNSDIVERDERIDWIANYLHMKSSAVNKLVDEAEVFRFYESIYHDDDVDDITEPRDFEDFSLPDPCELAVNEYIMSEVIDTIEKTLSYKAQQILYLSTGIACINCGRTCKRTTYSDIANLFENSSESSVEKLRKKSIEQIVYDLCQKKILTCVKLVRKKLTDDSLTYSYLVDDDGDDGSISFDISKEKSLWHCYEIIKLAELDTTLTHKYASRVVGIVNNMRDGYPKELLAVWWA